MQEIQPRDGSSGGGGGGGVQERVQEFSSRVYEEAQLDQLKLNIDDINQKLGENKDPYQNAFMQECACMNILIKVILTSLEELALAFKGELTVTEKMEALMQSVFLNKIPAPWAKYSFTSSRGLGSWLDNLKQRLE